MGTVKPKADVSAAVVSRFLKAAGMRRGTTDSTRVRGWHNFGSGFTVEQAGRRVASAFGGTRNVTENRAYVGWQHSSSQRSLTTEQRHEIEVREMAKAADILRGKGYTIEVVSDGRRLFVLPGA